MRGVVQRFWRQFIPLLLMPYFASGVDFDLDKLVLDANQTDKPILLFLHKDGCGFCEKMIFNLDEKDISKLIQANFIFVDINRDDGETISFQGYSGSTKKFFKKLGVELYPTIAFLDGKGEFIYHIVGYRNQTKFKTILKYIQSGAYKRITFEEFEDELHTNRE